MCGCVMRVFRRYMGACTPRKRRVRVEYEYSVCVCHEGHLEGVWYMSS